MIVLENFNDNTIIKTPFRIYKKILGGDKKEFYKDLTFLEIVGSSYLSICLYYFTKTDYERKKEEINDIKDNNLEERLK
ncbi:hypothetical protein HYX16_02480 [Candidatus Woesearchaeota archaeon]|nr:hypothetical protein [Candidatus Woesearchaeota archaeon]